MADIEPLPGRYARRMRLRTEHAQRLQEILTDTEQLDVRRPVALSELLLSELELIPSPERVEALAQQYAGIDLDGNRLPIAEHHREEARIQLSRPTMAMIDRYAKQQIAAAKQVEAGKMMRDAVLPMLVEAGSRVARIIERFVPEKDRQDAITELRSSLTSVLERIVKAGDAA